MKVRSKIQRTSPVLNPGDGAKGWFFDAFLQCFGREVSKQSIFEKYLNNTTTTRLKEVIAKKYKQPKLEVLSASQSMVFMTEVNYGYIFNIDGKETVLASDLTCKSDVDKKCLKEAQDNLETKRLALIDQVYTEKREVLFGSKNTNHGKYMALLDKYMKYD